MEDVFEEASEDEDMATLQRKRKQDRAEEGSPVRKRIKTDGMCVRHSNILK